MDKLTEMLLLNNVSVPGIAGGNAGMQYRAGGIDSVSPHSDTYAKEIIRLHRNTPNSYIDFFKDAIRFVGSRNFLDLGTTIADFDLDDLYVEKCLEWTDDDGHVELRMEAARLVGIRKDRTGGIVFLFSPEENYYIWQTANEDDKYREYEYQEYDEDAVRKYFKFDKRIQELTTEVYANEMDYFEMRNAALCVYYVLRNEVRNDPGRRFSTDDVRRLNSVKHYVSFAPSYNRPETYDSIIISKKPIENAYTSKEVKGFIKALELRDKIHSAFLYDRNCDYRYDDGSSDIASFLLTEEDREIIIRLFNKL